MTTYTPTVGDYVFITPRGLSTWQVTQLGLDDMAKVWPADPASDQDGIWVTFAQLRPAPAPTTSEEDPQ